MNHRLKPYPAYKDSGVLWLGEVPEHWDIKPIGRLGFLLKGRGRSKADEIPQGKPCIRYGDLYTQHEYHINQTRAFISKESACYYTPIEYGDILFAASGETIEDIGRSAVNLINSETFCGGDVLLFRPKIEFIPRYLGYASDSPASRHQKACMGKGFTVIHIYGSQLRGLTVPIPPLPEQSTIVRYLDYVDRRIQRYIRAKQKLIMLLEEQKQAIIHRAVTRGLDPKVRLKPSGVEWLGEVPEHWEVSRVKNEFLCLNRHRIPLSATERGAMTIRRYDYYGASGVIDKVDEYLFDDDLLLIAEDGANLVLRNLPLAIIARGQFWVNNHAHILKPRRGHLEYLAAIMEGINYQPWISGAAQPKLTQDRLMGIAIAVAPAEEQGEIISAIRKETAPLAMTIERSQREIDLLREYRTRLVADVVTGKLDVREAAARLPDEAPLATDYGTDPSLDSEAADEESVA